jgi:predicted PurR-regulated permease PerM
MTEDREFLRRLLIGAAVGSLFLIIAYIAVAFLAVLVLTIFLYYAVRPIFRLLGQFGIGRRIRAGLSILLFGLPFVALIGYTVAVVTAEAMEVLNEQGIVGSGADQLLTQLEIGSFNPTTLRGLVGDSSANISAVADQLLDVASLAGGLFVSTLLVVTGTYYLLVDGPRFAGWFLDTYDDTGIVRNYAAAVDSELSRTLFGNVVNILITAIIALVTFYLYNFFAPAAAAVPFPALLAALAGIASLIPVIGIKIVYIPLCLVLAANAWLIGQLELLGPIAVLAVISAVVVDFIPDIIVRAQISADQTHTGLLLVAYIVGPSVFGFYGLFLAPILLVATTNAVQILLPYALSGDRPDVQQTLDEYTDTLGPDDAAESSEESA